jgi:phosphoserine aminotransferase
LLGRSHRHPQSLAVIQEVESLTRELLEIPDDFLLAIVPGGDTGAVEMALWNFINGDRTVSTLAWEAFGESWASDIAALIGEQRLIRHSSPYGSIPDLSSVDWSTDLVFAWNGTTAGVKVPIEDLRRHVPQQRDNVIICDLTSAAFAMPIDWSIVDVGTLSWQKALGGEAAHGMLIMSPRAVKRLEESPPTRPLPKIMRLLDDNRRLNRSLFEGNVINTISMLCLEDFRQCLLWAKAIGREGLFARCEANVAAVGEAVAQYPWLTFLAEDERLRSPCGCCLRINDMTSDEIKQLVNSLAAENVAFDIAPYHSAPRGIRIWCGCTVEASDIRAFVPWLGWAHDLIKDLPKPVPSEGIRRVRSLKCLIADGLDGDAVRTLTEAGIDCVTRNVSAGDLGNFDCLCVRSATQVTDDLLASFGNNLKLVARAGVGVDNIDLSAASQRGVSVVNAPTAASVAVAELTLAHSLSMLRGLGVADRAAREGLWIKSKMKGGELLDRHVGVIGFGRIGSLVAERFRAFGARVMVFDPYGPAMQAGRRAGFELAEDLDDLFRKVTLVALHVPLTESTYHMVDERRLALMPAGSYIVNVARGGLVDERALLNALNSGHIAGAASDVFEKEPFSWEEETVRELLQHANFQSTPHIGAQTKEAQKRVGYETAAAIIQNLGRMVNA